MADLRTDYVDDILDTSVNTQRKYRQVDNDDGTVSFEDATVYTQNGDTFGASDINAVTQNLTAENGTSFNFAYNEETNEYGYMAKVEGADTFFPFSNAKKLYEALQYSGLVTEDMTFDEMCEVLAKQYPSIRNVVVNGVGQEGYNISGSLSYSVNYPSKVYNSPNSASSTTTIEIGRVTEGETLTLAYTTTAKVNAISWDPGGYASGWATASLQVLIDDVVVLTNPTSGNVSVPASGNMVIKVSASGNGGSGKDSDGDTHYGGFTIGYTVTTVVVK